MKLMKSFTVIVLNLVGELWIGLCRKPEFYDKHTVTRTKIGYTIFVLSALLLSVSVVTWAYDRLQ
ncbi:hypothetical protein BVG16_06545 [Paenibacillus selenitireducens]|uniref:Uncharacterized protein n=1 Tax=Paenibacillus selenitireducens TaxID=1324314 RepID=A0A1T2XKQ6_9BACL|nr:hypothetical protein [Paenibacillus selenitireducens]OPA80385.1 hypothetical protein BVG16_06545 [Paenibacillus selenitireducens]